MKTMHGWSNAFSCALGTWLPAHSYVFWVLIVGAALLLVAEGVYVARSIRESWQQAKESQRLREERENEWKMFQHQVWSTIRQGEEWDVDVSDLKASARRLTWMRKAAKAADDEKALFPLPIVPLFIILALGYFIPTRWMILVLLIVFGLSVIWWIYHGWKWYRYHWAFNALKQVEANAAKKAKS